MSDITFVGGPAGRQQAGPPDRTLWTNRLRRHVWIAAGAGVPIVLAVIYLVAGFVVADLAISKAKSTIRAVASHQASTTITLNQNPYVYLPLQTWPLDLVPAKANLALFEKRAASTAGEVKHDRAALLAARGELRSSWLTMPERGSMRQEAARLDAALSSLDAVDRNLAVQRQQAEFLHPFVEGLQGMESADKATNASDVPGALAQLPAAAAYLQTAVNRAVEPAVPPAVIGACKTLLSLVEDDKGMFEAAIAGDSTAMDRYAAAGDADAKSIDAFDLQSALHYEQSVLAKFNASYTTEIRAAAAGV